MLQKSGKTTMQTASFAREAAKDFCKQKKQCIFRWGWIPDKIPHDTHAGHNSLCRVQLTGYCIGSENGIYLLDTEMTYQYLNISIGKSDIYVGECGIQRCEERYGYIYEKWSEKG